MPKLVGGALKKDSMSVRYVKPKAGVAVWFVPGLKNRYFSA